MVTLTELSKAKKPAPKKLSRAEVDAKFLSRGVPPAWIREATGVDKMEVGELRALPTNFEEAHERGDAFSRRVRAARVSD